MDHILFSLAVSTAAVELLRIICRGAGAMKLKGLQNKVFVAYICIHLK
jgi:hypothetical protein